MKKDESQLNSVLRKRGFMLIEPLLAAALLAVVTLVIVSGIVVGQHSSAAAADRVKALFLANEGLEALRNIRDHAAPGLQVGEWGLGEVDGAWVLDATPDTTDERFTRALTVVSDGDVYEVTARVTWENEYGEQETTLESSLTTWR